MSRVFLCADNASLLDSLDDCGCACTTMFLGSLHSQSGVMTLVCREVLSQPSRVPSVRTMCGTSREVVKDQILGNPVAERN